MRSVAAPRRERPPLRWPAVRRPARTPAPREDRRAWCDGTAPSTCKSSQSASSLNSITSATSRLAGLCRPYQAAVAANIPQSSRKAGPAECRPQDNLFVRGETRGLAAVRRCGLLLLEHGSPPGAPRQRCSCCYRRRRRKLEQDSGCFVIAARTGAEQKESWIRAGVQQAESLPEPVSLRTAPGPFGSRVYAAFSAAYRR